MQGIWDMIDYKLFMLDLILGQCFFSCFFFSPYDLKLANLDICGTILIYVYEGHDVIV